MQLITFSVTDSSKSLYNACLANGIKVRAKIAKSNYIEALETFNAAVIEATEVVAEKTAPVIEAIAIVLTLVAYAGIETGKAARTHRIFPRLLEGVMIALGFILLAVDYFRTNDRYDILRDIVMGTEKALQADRLVDIEPAIVIVRTLTARVTTTIASKVPSRHTVWAYSILFKLAAKQAIREGKANGETWALSQGAL